MFNITVLKLKDLLKYIIALVIILVIVFFITKTFSKEYKNENKIINQLKNGVDLLRQNSLISVLEQAVPIIANINEEYKKIAKEDDHSKEDLLQGVLETQISTIKAMEDEEQKSQNVNKNNGETSNENTNEEEINEVQENNTNTGESAVAGAKTEVITNSPIQETYNTQYKNVKIKNQTDYVLTEEMLTPDITIENKNIILFHTHSCESYTSSELYSYTPTGNFRTTDLNFTVTRVGTELENQLKNYNYNVIHNTDYHDYPAYNGSYTRSLKTVENILQTNSADIIIDVHRDAIGSRSDYAPIVKIGDNDIAAQIMFVIGTNAGGLWHPNWNQNLKFAIKVQEKAEEMYPGLFKPMMLTKSRYNQHTGKYASIIEVGATGNTLEQCLTSMKYLAKVMDEVMK